MADLDERFERLLQRTQQQVALRRKREEVARRATLPPAELQAEVRSIWIPLREQFVRQIKLWDNRLIETGVRTSLVIDQELNGQIVERVTMAVSVLGSRGHDLTFSVVSGLKPYIVFSGPKGRIVNGDQGEILLDDLQVSSLSMIAIRHLELRIASLSDQ